jgi:hypothetical protein
MITKTKTDSLSSLIKKADDVFSKYIRNKYSINGYCYCFVCSTKMRIAESQTGHFIDRDQMPTRYDELNCHPVCSYCNCVDLEHRQRYEWMMRQVYPDGEVDALIAKSRGLQKFARYELVELIETYKEKLKKL